MFTLQKTPSCGCRKVDDSAQHERLKTETSAKTRFVPRPEGSESGPEVWATRSAVCTAARASHRRVGQRTPAPSPEARRGQDPRSVALRATRGRDHRGPLPVGLPGLSFPGQRRLGKTLSLRLGSCDRGRGRGDRKEAGPRGRRGGGDACDPLQALPGPRAGKGRCPETVRARRAYSTSRPRPALRPPQRPDAPTGLSLP